MLSPFSGLGAFPLDSKLSRAFGNHVGVCCDGRRKLRTGGRSPAWSAECLWVRLLSSTFFHWRSRMKALVYHGSKDVRVETAKDPVLQETDDIILRVTATAICGSDLHLYSGPATEINSGEEKAVAQGDRRARPLCSSASGGASAWSSFLELHSPLARTRNTITAHADASCRTAGAHRQRQAPAGSHHFPCGCPWPRPCAATRCSTSSRKIAARWSSRLGGPCRRRGLEISDLAPCRAAEPLGPVRQGINDRFGTGGKVRDQVAGARTDAEAVPGKARGQDEARHRPALRRCREHHPACCRRSRPRRA